MLEHTDHTFYLFHYCWSGMVNLQMTIMHNHYASGYSTVGDAKVVPILDHKLLFTELYFWGVLKERNIRECHLSNRTKNNFWDLQTEKPLYLNVDRVFELRPVPVVIASLSYEFMICSMFIHQWVFPSFHFTLPILPCLSSLYYTICKSF